MEYLDLLVKLRDCTREAEKVKRALMLCSNSRAETKEVLAQKSAYMRAEGERSHLMKEARQTSCIIGPGSDAGAVSTPRAQYTVGGDRAAVSDRPFGNGSARGRIRVCQVTFPEGK